MTISLLHFGHEGCPFSKGGTLSAWVCNVHTEVRQGPLGPQIHKFKELCAEFELSD